MILHEQVFCILYQKEQNKICKVVYENTSSISPLFHVKDLLVSNTYRIWKHCISSNQLVLKWEEILWCFVLRLTQITDNTLICWSSLLGIWTGLSKQWRTLLPNCAAVEHFLPCICWWGLEAMQRILCTMVRHFLLWWSGRNSVHLYFNAFCDHGITHHHITHSPWGRVKVVVSTLNLAFPGYWSINL